ncbi:hypothetical protein M972_112608 [Acetivibrio thermocellus AD2]|jgi:hypothetical protein|uniref:Lipoprotein n=1 Tax=Acetivibrio thermocellus AD2 TaxID=1138384 RepID=A0AB36TIU4_ACETH|nr:hypothetical protein [Acetivibrio thermocellus]ADU75514.1 hypothetical protein Clo1313_2504 [Acetivibrio thermocellus DSM 1313]ALX09517.1 hypothetical protein AD2_02531 [Acetivibrio thermocellus AD2]ANV77271.1 hypothetical protein LQRI_2530 [Acetivibrio thermocellus DSM 2360]EIC04641.1 hypothetical protein YSBL_1817 [Acetivibrio thermocellus YS]PFH03794.1 hypothetical protein M972_112608 [Acetivibrio thermocellus AD2]
MNKAKVIFVMIIFCTIFLLVACGGDDVKKNHSIEEAKTDLSQSTHGIEEDKEEKTNAEKFLEYVVNATDKRDFTKTGDYAGVLNTLGSEYKEDIINPYTGGKLLTKANRTKDLLYADDWVASSVSSVDCIVIDDYMTLLEELDTSEVVYCLNTESKGCVIGIILMDGVYIYEVDENGEKMNEIKHFFKEEK